MCFGMYVVKGFDANFAFAFGADDRVFAWGGGGRALFDGAQSRTRASEDEQHDDHCSSVDTAASAPVSASANTAQATSASARTTTACFLLPRDITAQLQSASEHQQQRVQFTQLVCARTDGHIGLVTDTGRCYMWGRGDYGELGVDTKHASVATPVNHPNRSESMSANEKSCASVRRPVPVEHLQHLKIKHVSVGNCHSAAVTTKGALYTWGGCWSGQLGLGESKRAGVKDKRQQLFFPSPTLVEALHTKHHITRVSCGAVHTAAVSSNGQLFTFGCGDGGRLGLGANGGDSNHPQLVQALERDIVLDVCCASWHSLCLVRALTPHQVKTRRAANERGAGVRRESESSMDTDGLAGSGYVYAFGSGLQGQVRAAPGQEALLLLSLLTMDCGDMILNSLDLGSKRSQHYQVRCTPWYDLALIACRNALSARSSRARLVPPQGPVQSDRSVVAPQSRAQLRRRALFVGPERLGLSRSQDTRRRDGCC